MSKTVRILLVVAGVCCFAAGAASAAGRWPNGNITALALALAGFGLWLASTLP